MNDFSLERLVHIAISLTIEKKLENILDMILSEAMEITKCDGGTVYVKDGDFLQFHNVVTKSMGTHLRADKDEIKIPPVPLGRKHVCAVSALDKRKINIADVYLSDEFDFSGAQRYDEMNGYRTCSMLVLPMEDEKGNCIGVLQLINAQDEAGNIVPFETKDEDFIYALTSLAAVSLNNNRLAGIVLDMLHSFVQVMVDSIDFRSPYNANHTRSMVGYATCFLEWLDENDHPLRFEDEKKDPFLMSVWLHDIGKLIVPLEIMDKSTRLGDMEPEVMHRIEIAILMEKLMAARNPEYETESLLKIKRFEDARELIVRSNTAGFLEDETIDRLKTLAGIPCMDSRGSITALLNEEELHCITIKRGTLTPEERAEMEGHVTYTARMLSRMMFDGDYAEVPKWAAAHHEFINGSGYPDHISGDEIPKEVRILTILDIYDSLTADDRPYKPPMPPDKAFAILRDMAGAGKLDADILEVFAESGAWKKTVNLQKKKD